MNALQHALNKLKEMAAKRVLGVRGSMDVVDDHLPEMADLVIEQLMAGKNAKGENIKPEYKSDAYAAEKNRMNSKPDFGVPDLKAEGDFHRSIHAVRQGPKIIFKATDEKAPELLDKYKDILGLTPENFKEFLNDVLVPYYLDAAKKKFLNDWKK